MFGLELHPAVIHYDRARRRGGRDLGPVRHAPKAVAALVRAGTAVAGPGRARAAYFSGQSAEDRAEEVGVPRAGDRPPRARRSGRSACSPWRLLAWATVAGRRGEWIAAPLAVAAAGLVLWAAHLGGRLVYVYGAGQVPKATVEPLQTPAEETAKEIEHE